MKSLPAGANILIVLTLLLLPVRAEADNTFRKTTWGMSKDDVRKVETGTFIKDLGETLLFGDKVIGLNVLVHYTFTNNELSEAGYDIVEEHVNKNLFISDYDRLKEMLVLKYGSPKSDAEHWSNNLYKSDRQEWGMAVSVGHHSRFVDWETEDTEIVMALMGDNFKVKLAIGYGSKKLGPKQQEQKTKKDLENF